ncbi:kelch-like protein 24a isoform X2 [Lineus longissimus]|uniref:kelch-like protein 24a isoform X2 n=1 Tax=Lineus longissimus TaxID=88925 RepID=UPI00315CF8E4
MPRGEAATDDKSKVGRGKDKMDECREGTETTNNDEVTITVDGERFVFSGKQLADKSDYFDAMFYTSCMKECITRQVELNYISVSDMEVIRDFIEEKQPGLNKQNILSVTSAATMLQLKHLCEKCCEYLLEMTDPSNCLSVMKFAEQQSLQLVHNKAKRIAMWNLLEVVESEEYSMQTFAELSLYLGSGALNLELKADAVYAILKWAWATGPNSRCSAEDLTSLLAIFCHGDDVSCINDVVQNAEELSKLSLKEIRERLKSLDEMSSYCFRRPSFPRVLLVVGGDLLFHDSKLPNTKISYLDPETQNLKTLTNIPFQEGRPACSMGYKCCVVGKDLYITGGEKNRGRNQWCRDVWRYNPFEDVWDVPTELPGPRRHHCVCTDGENMYLMGGFGSYRYILDTTDVYNVNTGEWSSLPPLPRPEFSATCACDNERIYVIKSIIQIYTKATDSWSLINPPLPYSSKIHSLHSFGHKLIMVAEFSGKLLEFDTRTGQIVEEIATFKEACGSGCFVDGVFYIVGGSDMDESACVECFQTVTKTVAKFEAAIANHACLALPFWLRAS